MHWPFPSRPVRPLLGLSVPETEEGTRIQVSKTRSKCPPDYILSFFSRWVRETEVAGPGKPLRGGGGVGWGAPLVSPRRDGSPRRAAAVGEGGLAHAPQAPQAPQAHGPRMTSDAGELAERRRGRRRRAGGGAWRCWGERSSAQLGPCAPLHPCLAARAEPRASTTRLSPVQPAPPSAAPHTLPPPFPPSPPSDTQPQAGAGPQLGSQGRAQPTLPPPAPAPLAASPRPPTLPSLLLRRFLLLLLFGPQLPAPCPQGEILGTRCENSSWCSWGSRAVSTRFILGSEPSAFPMPPIQSPHWGPSQPRLTKALPRPGGGGKGCRWGNGAGSGGAGLGRTRGKGWRRLRGQGMRVRVGSG